VIKGICDDLAVAVAAVLAQPVDRTRVSVTVISKPGSRKAQSVVAGIALEPSVDVVEKLLQLVVWKREGSSRQDALLCLPLRLRFPRGRIHLFALAVRPTYRR
jgi:hypothetical protein